MFKVIAKLNKTTNLNSFQRHVTVTYIHISVFELKVIAKKPVQVRVICAKNIRLWGNLLRLILIALANGKSWLERPHHWAFTLFTFQNVPLLY